jgi:hypothetical protein
MDLCDYIREAKPAEIKGDPDEPLPPSGVTSLRGVNGTLGFALGARPDACGMVAVSASNVAKDEEGNGPCWRHLQFANSILSYLKETNERFVMWYPRMCKDKPPPLTGRCSNLALLLLSDSAFANLSSKHSQGGFILMLCEISEEGQIGGPVHIIDFSSQRSTRVARSTFAAELLSATRGLERAELMLGWVTEIFQGVMNPRDALERESMIPLFAGIDAKGLFDCLAAREMGKLTDKSMLLYALAYREALHTGMIEFLFWIPTESMLADELTKFKSEVGQDWLELYDHGYWYPRLRLDLPEDLCTFHTASGFVCRWRMVEG